MSLRLPWLAIPLGVLVSANLLQAQSAPVDPTVQKLIGEVSPVNVAATVKALASFETRSNSSDPAQKSRGIGAASRWISAQLHSYSARLKVTNESGNIVALLPGVAEPDKRILVTAHYDSINAAAAGTKASEAPAPGADDDASGTAVVLELARVMSRYQFRKSIVFVAFSGEEIGLIGSTRYAAAARTAREQIEAVFNNDIVGTNQLGTTRNLYGLDEESADGEGDTGNRLNIYSPDEPAALSRGLAIWMKNIATRYVPRLKVDLVSRADRFGRGGDQIPFQKNGFAAVRLTSASENTALQHTAQDLPDGVSAVFTSEVARLNAAAIATLAVPTR